MPRVVRPRNLLAGLVVWTGLAQGQNDARPTAGDGGGAAARLLPTAIGRPVSGAVVLDGRLNEEAWRDVPAVTEFTQMDPREGAPATERTEVRIVFDRGFIYVGARLYDSGPVTRRVARRDSNLPDSDWFAIAFDSYHDHQTAVRFSVNPAGVLRDEVMTGTNQFGDDSWDGVWEARTRVDSTGWTVEMRIPLSQLRFAPQQSQVWGVQIERRIARKNEHVVFAFTPRLERGGVARYGHLEGLELSGSTPSKLELLPYALAKADVRAVPLQSGYAFPNPFRGNFDQSLGYGLDFKYLPSSNLALTGTVNPDFGQVEVDPAVINLTVFETRFQEKRPFFVEGSELFRFGGGEFGGGAGGPGGGGGRGGGGAGQQGPEGGGPSSIFYSRRIGRSPQVSLPSQAVYSDIPQAAAILGALKLTTRTANGWSFGLIDAVTGRALARYADSARSQHEFEVEPLTNYVAGRARRDMRSGQSMLGAIATAVNRDLSSEASAARLRASAYVVGLDFRHEWAERSWSANGFWAGSQIRGAPSAILIAQRSSARYFQRPDATHLAIDSNATSLQGYSARLDVGKRAGVWRGNVALSLTSPGYEINDLGFQTAADRISLDVNINYEQTRSNRLLRRWTLRSGPDVSWNFARELVRNSVGFGGNGQFMNFWNFGFNYSRELPSLDDRLTRGGVMAATPAGHSGFLFLSSDSRRAYTVRGSVRASVTAAGDRRFSSNINLGIRPGPNVDLQVGPSFSRSRESAQWLRAVSDTLATSTAGRRYLFGDLLQTTFSLETRVNIAFRPNVSLEFYIQPLIASGNYRSFKELRAARTFEFDVYGRDRGTVQRDTTGRYTIDPDGAGPASAYAFNDPSFDTRSLRGNAVLRWEWRPGSALFVVWQQERSAQLAADGTSAGVGSFSLAGDSREIFKVKPANVFMLKATYWLNP
jgi:hypothetical protein